jgi:acetyl-CoA acetyltransferase
LRDVSIMGIGQTKVGEHWDKSLRQLAMEAVKSPVRSTSRPSSPTLQAYAALRR